MPDRLSGLVEGHQVDAVVAWRVDAAAVGFCGGDVAGRGGRGSIGDHEARERVHVVPAGLGRLLPRHEVDELISGRVDAATVGVGGQLRRAEAGPQLVVVARVGGGRAVGADSARASAQRVPEGLGGARAWYEIDGALRGHEDAVVRECR